MRGLFFVILLAVLPSAPAFAAPAVRRVEIKAKGVREEAVRALLETREGRAFDPAVWSADVARLRDAGWFHEVRESVTECGEMVCPALSLRAKWTVIPIFKFKRGGGASHLAAGVYDSNLGGSLLEAGARYERLSGRDGAVAWFRHPYFGSPRLRFGAEVYDRATGLPLLDKSGAAQAHFDNEEFLAAARLEREYGPRLTLTLEASLARNAFNADDSSPGNAARNAAFLAASPLRRGRTVAAAAKARLGRLRREGWRSLGAEVSLELETAQGAFGSDFAYWKGVASWRGAALPAPRLELAGRAMLGSKSGREFQHKFYLGGLDTLRGFLDGQFRGEHAWQVNLEARPTLLERKLWALQGAVFADAGKTWDSQRFGLEGFRGPAYLSAGAGIRFILPRVYRGVLRLDVARTLSPAQGWGLNFGAQQFF